MTTLANMRTLVRQFLDDNESDTEEQRWADTEIDFALEASLEALLALYGQKGTRLDQQTEVATSSGEYALTTEKPLIIKGVEYKVGNVYVPLLPADHQTPTVEDADATLRVTYVGKPTFPTVTSDEVSYGASSTVNLKLFDRMIARRAALDLLPKDGERNQAHEMAEQKDWEAISRMSVIPRGREMVPAGGYLDDEGSYFSGQTLGYRWAFVPGTLTLKLVF